MAKVVVNPPAQLVPRPSDVDLTLDQLALLGVFASLKKAPSFAKFPGTFVLRHYRRGEVVCRQGDAGGTAFYMLTAGDVAALAASGVVDAADTAAPGPARHIRELGRRPGDDKPHAVATARLSVERPRATKTSGQQSWWSFCARGSSQSSPRANPATIAIDGPADIDYQSRQASIFEGEVFGEMSCLTRQPRSATIVAETECLALEFLRNILDQMRKDPEYKKLSDEQYRQRVMEGHLRQLSIFKMLSDREFDDIVKHVEFQEFEPGSVLWDEGDAPMRSTSCGAESSRSCSHFPGECPNDRLAIGRNSSSSSPPKSSPISASSV